MGKIGDIIFYTAVGTGFYIGATYCIDAYFSEKKKDPLGAEIRTLEKLALEINKKGESVVKNGSDYAGWLYEKCKD